MYRTIDLGTLELSGKAVVSDPCYDRDVQLNISDISVQPGMYTAHASVYDEAENGIRIACLAAVHTDHRIDAQSKWKLISSSIRVGSGQCGIFDDTIYPQKGAQEEWEAFYAECGNIITSVTPAGILHNGKGVVTSSGYGDGTYKLHGVSEHGMFIALSLDYGLLQMRKVFDALISK